MNARHLIMIVGMSAGLGLSACGGPDAGATAPAPTGAEVAALEEIVLEVTGMT